MDRRMRVIAGKGALDCGRVEIGRDPRDSLRCARRAISKNRAFIVRFDMMGTDSFISDGFAGNGRGYVYSVSFDDRGWGPSPGVEMLDDSHDAVSICPQPVHIGKAVSSLDVMMGYRCTRWKTMARLIEETLNLATTIPDSLAKSTHFTDWESVSDIA